VDTRTTTVASSPYGEHSDRAPPERSGISAGWAVLIVIVVIIIIVVIIWLFARETDTTLPSLTHTWTITDSSSSTATFKAEAGTLIRNTSSGNVTYTLGPGVQGQEFIIDNSRGGGTVTITGATVSPTLVYNGNSTAPSNVIVRGKTSGFVWETSTSLIRLW
jgi:hypothetical protein